jgi:ribosome-associated protein
MDDTSKNSALDLCALLQERGAGDVVGLRLSPDCSWASYLVIGTVTSGVHMQGLSMAVRDRFRQDGLEVRSGSRRSEETSWRIIDGGNIVVSLMDKDARAFYALEDRWFESELIYRTSESRTGLAL